MNFKYKDKFTSGKITLYLGDCMEFLSGCKDNEFDLALTDPPYRDKNEPDQWLRANNGDMKKWHPAPKKEYFIELKRISKNQIIWGGNYFTNYLEPNNNWIIWHKLNEGVHFSMCEMAYCTIKKNIQLKKMLPEKNKIHPTQKPVALYKWLLHNYAKPDYKILDTHLGSGSSAIAAHYDGCEFTGIEIDQEYYTATVERFKKNTRQLEFSL